MCAIRSQTAFLKWYEKVDVLYIINKSNTQPVKMAAYRIFSEKRTIIGKKIGMKL